MVTFALRTTWLIHRLTNQQLSAEGTRVLGFGRKMLFC